MNEPGPRLHYVILERVDPSRNMDRYYVLSVEPTLFPGDFALVREWGRAGVTRNRRLDLFRGRTQALSSLEHWLRIRRRRGYTVRDAEWHAQSDP